MGTVYLNCRTEEYGGFCFENVLSIHVTMGGATAKAASATRRKTENVVWKEGKINGCNEWRLCDKHGRVSNIYVREMELEP